MKTTCLQENLHRALGIVGGAIPKGKASNPITQNVLMECEGGQLKLKGTDLSTTISVWIDAMDSSGEGVLVPHKYFQDLIGSLPRDKVVLETKGANLTVKCGKSVAKLRIDNHGDYPVENASNATETILLEGKVLKEGLAVVYAAAISVERGSLRGVKIGLGKGTIEFAATDGYKLAVQELKADVDSAAEVVIPREAIETIKSMLGEETVAIGIGKGRVSFQLPSFQLTTSLLAETFPIYKQVMPSGYDCSIEVNRLELLRTLRSAVILPTEQKVVWMVVKSDSVLLKSKSQELGEYESVVAGEGKGEGKIAFNGEDLVVSLGSMSGNKVTLEIGSTTQPILLRDGGYRVVLMPVITQWWE